MRRLRNRHLMLIDALLLLASPFLVYTLRFEGLRWIARDLQTPIVFAILNAVLVVGLGMAMGLYQRLWRYASLAELELIFLVGSSGAVLGGLLGALVLPWLHITPNRVPLSVLFTNGLLLVSIIATPRLLVRMGARKSNGRILRSGTRVLIAGAGSAGHMFLRELRENPSLDLYPVGFVDDDASKQGLRLSDVPVLGPLSAAADIIAHKGVDVLVVAMPTAPGSIVRPVVRAALDAGIQTRTIPSLTEIISGRVNVTALRNVEIQDLLRREPIQTDMDGVLSLAANRTVLVTGAGGSIGSELCRQIAQLGPTRLLILGHGENPIFEMQHELRVLHPDLEVVPLIGDIRNRRRVIEIFRQHRPFSVFHAAAHKHVPLMEHNVVEAVTNNIVGTKNIVDAAVEFGVTHFVLISTDKAVRPANVMGATKRVAEHIVRQAALEHQKNFVAVRFGNVLGSRGSVVPTFVKQIRAGGPVTVTHPDMRRYFMTIPEAVQLVLQAGALGRGGELFMLDMGEPVKVVDLARDLIRLSGLEEGEDIEIKFTGIRPGEKLYEEMFLGDEFVGPTEHPKVLRVKQPTLGAWGAHLVEQLMASAQNGCVDAELRRMLKDIVPDFCTTAEVESTPTPSFSMPVIPDTSIAESTLDADPVA